MAAAGGRRAARGRMRLYKARRERGEMANQLGESSLEGRGRRSLIGSNKVGR